MTILITRPFPDSEATAGSLRARGYDVLLAPVLKFEPVAFGDDGETNYDAVIVTSANAIRAAASQLQQRGWLELPVFAVGEKTARCARDAGFTKVTAADGDAVSLLDLIRRSKALRKQASLLYLAGTELTRDLASDLGEHGFNVVTQTTYRMAPVLRLPRDVCDGFAADRIEAVLHYSLRSARSFLDATRAEGVEISALAVLQCCLSEPIAAVLREAGAAQVAVAASPDESALFGALERALRPRLA